MKGGTSQDPQGREGTANMVAAMMDEGAGDLDSETFSARLQDRAIEISFAASRDTFSGSMRTLTDNRAEAANLLRMALTAPRFDAAPLERIRQAVLASIRRGSTNPGTIASDLFWSTAFPATPMADAPPARWRASRPSRSRICARCTAAFWPANT